MEQAIKEVMRQQHQGRPTQRRAAINTATPSHTQARDKLQEMQRLIDQLITPALRDQSTALDDVRAGLQTAYLHWEINSHIMATLDKVQDSLREDLLRKSLEAVVLCRKTMQAIGELRCTDVVNKGKGDEEKLFLMGSDRAVDILEGLMLG
jgi:hypothetical protein